MSILIDGTARLFIDICILARVSKFRSSVNKTRASHLFVYFLTVTSHIRICLTGDDVAITCN